MGMIGLDLRLIQTRLKLNLGKVGLRVGEFRRIHRRASTTSDSLPRYDLVVLDGLYVMGPMQLFYIQSICS